ncbi:BA75_00228T0 [Komagataella pastoris]|uniref:BA75_00228T0 n=1 Tax=Komagataella pastoris TaxID=4922 RepID=A0A1B2J987_PICPA|nr:BA75_00228T0 [Komagataella pastoris]
MRRLGLSALDNVQNHNQRYQEVGKKLLEDQTNQLQTQLTVFQNGLISFIKEHKKDIEDDPKFRTEFSQICLNFGVDPLAAFSIAYNGERRQATGRFKQKDIKNDSTANQSEQDFYNDLGIKIMEICQDTADINGGVISIKEILQILSNKPLTKLFGIQLTQDDIVKSINSLTEALGTELQIITIGHKLYCKSVPQELNKDNSTVLETCGNIGFVTVSLLIDNFGWKKARATTVLEDMVANGLLWIDEQASEIQYWELS